MLAGGGGMHTCGVGNVASKEIVFLYYHNDKVGMNVNIPEYLLSYKMRSSHPANFCEIIA